MTTTPVSDPTIEILLNIFSGTLTHIGEAVSDIPESRMAEQPLGLANHPAWTLSHLCAAAGLILTLLDEAGDDVAAAEFERFGPGSVPLSDPALYIAKPEALAKLADRHAHAARAVRAKHAEHFHRLPPEKLRAFAPTIGRIVVYLLAAHESYHLGQLMQWRRAAGIGAK